MRSRSVSLSLLVGVWVSSILVTAFPVPFLKSAKRSVGSSHDLLPKGGSIDPRVRDFASIVIESPPDDFQSDDQGTPDVNPAYVDDMSSFKPRTRGPGSDGDEFVTDADDLDFGPPTPLEALGMAGAGSDEAYILSGVLRGAKSVGNSFFHHSTPSPVDQSGVMGGLRRLLPFIKRNRDIVPTPML